LIAKSGENDNKKEVHFYYNYSSVVKEFKYPHSPGTELVSDKPVANDEILKLGPWDVLIIEEN